MDGDGTPTTQVDERVAQLQHALTSRIVVEQAKGMLAERYSLAPDEAYELIRLAARSNGMKVHALSNSVLASPRRTPPEILALFTHLPGNGVAPGRAVENVFREINASFLKLDGSRFVCECSDPGCADAVDVSSEIMRSLTADPDLYVLKPGHVNSDLEEIVEAHDEFVVVRKPASS
jgi:hypothetical protein